METSYKNNQPELSIIYVSFNLKDMTLESIASVEKHCLDEVASGNYEIIVSDNGSSDGIEDAIKEYKKQSKIKTLKFIQNNENLGFSRGNNAGIRVATGKYVLFLNTDTLVYENSIQTVLEFVKTHPKAGSATCKLMMPNGKMDDACHRGFPTPWNSFTHFSKLERIFPKSRLFARYIMGWEDLATTHEVDSIEGAFMLVPREAGEKIGWWDEDYFLNGEDIDFCYMLKQKGYKNYYIPTVTILHYKGVTMGTKKISAHITTASKERKIRSTEARFNAMKIFYEKHYKSIYSPLVMNMCFMGINLLRWYFMSKIPKTSPEK